MVRHDYPLSVLFERDPDLPGIWNATILEIDGVTFGPSLREASELASDMAAMLIANDLVHGREPLRDAPAEERERYRRICQNGKHVRGSILDLAAHEDVLDCVTAVLYLSVFVQDEDGQAEAPLPIVAVHPVAESTVACH